MYIITLKTSPLFMIEINQPVYGQGMMHIHFHDEYDEELFDQFCDQIIAQCCLSEPFIIDMHFSTSDMDKSRKIVEFLKNLNFLSEHDYAELLLQVINVEKILSQQTKIDESATTSQKETLSFIISPYIEDIVESTKDYKLALKIFTAALSAHIFGYNYPLAFSHLDPADHMAVLLDRANIKGDQQKSILDCGRALHKIYIGEAKLESTYMRQASHGALIGIKLQRSIIIDDFLKKMFGFYEKLSAEQKLVIGLSCEIFANAMTTHGDVSYISFDSLEETVSVVLSNILSPRVQNAMNSSKTMPGGQKGLLQRTLDRIKFSEAELKELLKIDCLILRELISHKLKAQKEVKTAPPEAAIKSSTESKASLPVQLSKMRIGSPISVSGDIHNQLVAELSIITNKKPSKYKPFMDAIHEKKYSKALRRACNFADDHVFNLIKILLKYQGQLKFDVNEQAGDKKYAAIHFAAKAKNTDAYEYLIKHGANIHLVDADGISAEKHRELNPPAPR